MEDIRRQTTDVHNPQWEDNTVLLWKGDHVNGWQICMDERRTEGRPGRVMPVIFPYDASTQITYSGYRVDSVTRKKVRGVFTQPEAKGWRPAEEAEDARPSKEIIDYLLTRFLAEMDEHLKEEGMKDAKERARELDAYHVMIYRANDLEDPDVSQLDDIRLDRDTIRDQRQKSRAAKARAANARAAKAAKK